MLSSSPSSKLQLSLSLFFRLELKLELLFFVAAVLRRDETGTLVTDDDNEIDVEVEVVVDDETLVNDDVDSSRRGFVDFGACGCSCGCDSVDVEEEGTVPTTTRALDLRLRS